MKHILKKPFFSILSIAVLLVTSCTERYDIELDGTYTRCVVYGEFTTDTIPHKVTITRSGGYFSNTSPQGISAAQVSITEGTTTYILTESVDEPGNYYTQPDAFGIEGKTYTLNIENVNLLGDGVMQSYTATSFLPPVAEPDSIKVIYMNAWQGWITQAYALDPAASNDFYMFHTWVNDTLETDSLGNIISTDDILFNGSYTNGISIHYWQGYDALEAGDSIVAGFCGITEDYFKFITEAQTASRPSSPLFSGPPANPRTNISNNGIGYFTAYSIKRTMAVIPSLPPL